MQGLTIAHKTNDFLLRDDLQRFNADITDDLRRHELLAIARSDRTSSPGRHVSRLRVGRQRYAVGALTGIALLLTLLVVTAVAMVASG
jgi:hypothetical protein